MSHRTAVCVHFCVHLVAQGMLAKNMDSAVDLVGPEAVPVGWASVMACVVQVSLLAFSCSSCPIFFYLFLLLTIESQVTMLPAVGFASQLLIQSFCSILLHELCGSMVQLRHLDNGVIFLMGWPFYL